jgi:transcriptional regulator with XRE-family HTH domain
MAEYLYHYTGCGLDYVYLANGFEERETPFGRGVAIHDLDGLHTAIATDLVNNKPNWTGAELRFIRKELGFTQQRLGEFVGRSSQSVALWEKEKQKIPPAVTNIVRGIYKSRIDGNVQFEMLLERINDLDRQLNDLQKKIAYRVDGVEGVGWHADMVA